MAKKKDDGSQLESILAQYGAEKTFEFVSTGSIVLDAVLGGGINPGSMYCAWGSQGSGKTSFTLNIVKSFLKKGIKCAFIDVEKAFNVKQQQAFGLREYVESRDLVVLTADNYNDVFTICKALATSGEYKLIVIDSETMINEVVSEDIDILSNQPGQKARQSAKVLSGLKSIFYKNDVASIWLSHARANIDMNASRFAEKEKLAGGYGLRHVPDVIIKVAPGTKLTDSNDKTVGQVVHIVSEKNKFTPPFQKFDIKLFFGKGIDRKVEVVDLATEQGIITKEGLKYVLPDGTSVRPYEALYDLDLDKLRDLKSQLRPLIDG